MAITPKSPKFFPNVLKSVQTRKCFSVFVSYVTGSYIRIHLKTFDLGYMSYFYTSDLLFVIVFIVQNKSKKFRSNRSQKFYKKRCFKNFRKFHRKTTVLKSVFNKDADITTVLKAWKPVTLLQKDFNTVVFLWKLQNF